MVALPLCRYPTPGKGHKAPAGPPCGRAGRTIGQGAGKAASTSVQGNKSMPFLVVLRPLLPYIIGSLMILGMGYWIHSLGYRSGVDDTTVLYESKIQRERERLQAANEAALENAKIIVEQLRSQLSSRNETIRLLSIEAMSSPGSGDQCIDVDGVRRLNNLK